MALEGYYFVRVKPKTVDKPNHLRFNGVMNTPQAAESLLAAMRASLQTALRFERAGDHVRASIFAHAAADELERAIHLQASA